MKHDLKRSVVKLLLLTLFATASRGFAAAAATNSAAPALDARSFQVVAQRNIFDPNRRPSVLSQPRVRIPPTDWFVLSGTMSYPNQLAKESYAFFQGSSRQYQQVFKTSDTIAGFKIAEIASDYVKLAGPDNKSINLHVQSQMRKPQGGAWTMVASPDAPPEPTTETPATAAAAPDETGAAAPATSTAPATTGAGGSADDVMKRMMERRAKEQ